MQEAEVAQPPVVADQPGSTPAAPGVTDQTVAGGRSDPVVLDAVASGTPEATAQTVEHAEAGAHHETFLGLDSYGWVAGSFIVFVLLLLKLKVPKMIGEALDARGRKIAADLEEARRLRAEAEALLAGYQAKQKQAAADVETIVSNAKAEAERIVADAQAQADALVARRTRMAEDRIAAAERAATADLRAQAAALAAEAARRVLTTELGAKDQAKLADEAIAELDARLN